MRGTLAAILLALSLVAIAPGCESTEARQVQQELVRVEVAADEARAAGDLEHAAALDRILTGYRARLAAESADQAVRSGDSAMGALSNGDILAALAAIGGGGLIMRQRMRRIAADLQAEIVALGTRRDESRRLQGIAAASERSAVQAQSPVALVAFQAEQPKAPA